MMTEPPDGFAGLLRAFVHYERRFAGAMAMIPNRHPLRDREEIRGIAKECLGVCEKWIPSISPGIVRTTRHDGFRVEYLAGTSWPGVHVAAHLYVPEGAPTRECPFVLLCCGHGNGCKINPEYQATARHLARSGTCVLIADSIGQGEREPMGHRESVVPFACGTSVQGLIVLEAMGWLAWARRDERFDGRRMGACGNSGGGHLTRWLATLDDELAALASSGQAGTIAYTARKERRLCHCAVVPGLVGEIEMWQQYGCFAPRPLLLYNGRNDHMFPADLFWHTARKVSAVYAEADASAVFLAEMPPGGHSWDPPRRKMLGDFMADCLGLEKQELKDIGEEDLLDWDNGSCYTDFPGHALDMDGLARELTGVDADADLQLWDVFQPEVQVTAGAITPNETNTGHGANDVRQIFAQFEAFLQGWKDRAGPSK